MKTIEGNELIAHYMGVTWDVVSGDHYPYNYTTYKKKFKLKKNAEKFIKARPHLVEQGCFVISNSRIEYNSDWNLLIPVAKKVFSLSRDCENSEGISEAISMLDKQWIWEECIKFIKTI